MLVVGLDSLMRQSSNPFFPYMIKRIDEGIDTRPALSGNNSSLDKWPPRPLFPEDAVLRFRRRRQPLIYRGQILPGISCVRRLLPQFGDVIQPRHGVRLGRGKRQPGIFQRMRQLHLRHELLIGDGVQFDFDIRCGQRAAFRGAPQLVGSKAQRLRQLSAFRDAPSSKSAGH